MLRIILDKKKKWKMLKKGGFRFYFKGNIENIESFAARFSYIKYKEKFSYFLKQQNFDFSIIIESRRFVIAAVDKIKSHSIFYSKKFNIISNSPGFLDTIKAKRLSEKNLIEFQMAGFIQHNQTFYEDIFQLEAGSFLESKKKDLIYKSYYSYLNRTRTSENFKNYKLQLSKVLNKIFSKILQIADGRQICVPLSGGLDSRLVLSKIKELGYENIFVFSYGVKNNHDAMTAKKMCEKLNIPWHFEINSTTNSRNFFKSSLRQCYFQFANQISVVPSYLDFEAIYNLKKKKKIESNAIIINGQTGDFISGGHLPKDNCNITHTILSKHFGLWKSLIFENEELVKDRINQHFNLKRKKKYEMYEFWEWKERQSKFVVNGQQVYDFFELNWFLPFWSKSYLDFWSKVPYNLKKNQKLYIQFLREYNYGGLFDQIRFEQVTWPYHKNLILFLARSFGLLFGERSKKKIYELLFYYSTYHYQFAYMGLKNYLNHRKDARSIVSLFTRQIIDELVSK